MPTASQIHSIIEPRRVSQKGIAFTNVMDFEDLDRIGLGFDSVNVNAMYDRFVTAYKMAFDSIQQPLTTASIPNLQQFLQNWLPGIVKIMTAARKIDDITGMQTVGSWEDEEVIQTLLENQGTAIVYGDYSNVPLSDWNVNYENRTNVRFESGFRVGRLEEARAGRQNINSGAEKRLGAAQALEIQRNAVGFYGFNDGNNKTYGYLNDPGLPTYQEVAATGSGSSTLWSSKTFLEICADLRTAYQALRTQSQDTIDPETHEITLVIATAARDYLSTNSDFNVSVEDWIKKSYPKTRIVSAPQLNSAHSSLNVFYMHADTVTDGISTDGGQVFAQIVPAKFQLLGVQQLVKGYEEDYTNATAGIMLKRPYAVVRYFGI